MTATETRDYTGVATEQVVREMLLENTGSSLVDSGGAYGRHWSSNQGRDFAAEPKCTTHWDVTETTKGSRPSVSCTVSLYHWMVEHLEFDAEMQQELDTYMADEDLGGLQAADLFADHLHDADRLAGAPYLVNTYGMDGIDLSQVVQFQVLCAGDAGEPTHLILCVHGGCDIRGGYTEPKCFRLRTEYDEAIDNAQASHLSAGEAGWHCHGPGWDCVTPSGPNDLANPLDLNAYTSHGLIHRAEEEWDVPRALQPLKDMREAIYMGDLHINRLKGQDGRSPEDRRLLEGLLAGREEMRGLAFDTITDLSDELAEDFIYVEAGRAWLVIDGTADELNAEVSF